MRIECGVSRRTSDGSCHVLVLIDRGGLGQGGHRCPRVRGPRSGQRFSRAHALSEIGLGRGRVWEDP
jgi:hypothetical protein